MSLRLCPDVLAEWTAAVLETCDVPSEHAAETASMLVRSELRG
jgi:hypothetical protein